MIHSELTAETSSKLTSTDVRYIKNNLNRNKLKSIPKLLKSLEEVHQFLGEVEILVKTVQNENFICTY
jgi:5-bromo-4-chloroindolyl phosphate hydrolysis protein